MPVIDSQWAAQFAVAAELVRRRYSVAFYLGNQPLDDALMRGSNPVTSSRYRSRAVKTLRPKNQGANGPAILVGKLHAGNPEDLFVIVQTPPELSHKKGQPFRFSLLLGKKCKRSRIRANHHPDSKEIGFIIPTLLVLRTALEFGGTTTSRPFRIAETPSPI